MASEALSYPIFVDLRRQRVVIVGGGSVAHRKMTGLLETGAQILLVAPTRTTQSRLPSQVEWIQRTYSSEVLEGAYMVFAATDDVAVNRQIIEDAHARQLLCSSADAPMEGNFTLPATLRRGDLTVAVATNGQSPALAALLRDRFDEQLGEEWSRLTELAGRLRQRLLQQEGHAGRSRELLRKGLNQGMDHRLAAGTWDGAEAEVDRLLSDTFASEDTGPKGRL